MESYDERRRREEERRQARNEDNGRHRDTWWRPEGVHQPEHEGDHPRRAERGWLDYDRDYGRSDERQGRYGHPRYDQGDDRQRFSPDWSREGAQARYSDDPYYSRNRERDDDYSSRSRAGGSQSDDRLQWEQRSRDSVPRSQRELANRGEPGDYYNPDWPYDRGARSRDVERSRGGDVQRGGEDGPYAGRGPKGYKRSDQQIVEEACQRLERDGGIDASDIEVTAEDGLIRLRGTVHDRREKRRAEECVESIYGARDVMNELRVSKQQGQGTQSGQGTQASQGAQTPGQRPGAGSATADQLGDDKRTPRH